MLKFIYHAYISHCDSDRALGWKIAGDFISQRRFRTQLGKICQVCLFSPSRGGSTRDVPCDSQSHGQPRVPAVQRNVECRVENAAETDLDTVERIHPRDFMYMYFIQVVTAIM